MKAKWVVEKGDLERENWDKIVEHLKSSGREVVRPNYIPFTNDKVDSPFGDEDCVVAFGCLGLVRAVGRNNKWVPGVWCDWEALKCSRYLAHLGQYSVQQHYGFYPLEEVWRKRDWLFETYSKHSDPKLNGHIFIRPDDNFKSFNGERVCAERWDAFRRNVNCYTPSQDILCMVASPVDIRDEWRFVVVDGQIITGSQYRKEGSAEIEPVVESGAEAFGQMILDKTDWRPHPVFTIDICKLGDGEYRLMEVGSVNAAGLYCCDIPKLVEAISTAAEKEWESIYKT